MQPSTPLAGLNPFSSRFADRLLTAFPDFSRHARGDEGVLIVQVPSPVPESPRQLVLATDDDEISIGFDNWHAHVGDKSTTEEQKFTTAIELVHDFLHDRVMVAVRVREQHFLNAQLVHSLDEISDEGSQPGDMLFVRSFNGTHDGNYRAQNEPVFSAEMKEDRS